MEMTSSKTQRQTAAQFTIACVLLLISINFFASINKDDRSQSIPHGRYLKANANHERPVMHTFYSHLKDSERTTGMTDDADRRLLEVWRSSWEAAGWDTKILGLADAMAHPDFQKFDEALESNVNNPYDRLCFLRWLAMAHVGGGWMSDYDVLPVPTSKKPKKKLPNNGQLTMYEFTLDGGVPSLVSGSASEWNRMANLLLEKSFDPDILSDMFAIIWYHHNNPNVYILENKVIKGHVPMSGRIQGKELCRVFKGFWAVHFSHAAMKVGVSSGILSKDKTPASRAEVSRDWIKEWIVLCGVPE